MHRDVLRYRVEAHKRWQYDLTLELAGDEAARLADWLDTTLHGKERSVSLPHSAAAPLPGSWRLFFKLRDADNRLLLAHPSEEEWVATFALEQAVLAAFLTQLRSGQPGRLDRLGQVHPLSNVHLSFEIS